MQIKNILKSENSSNSDSDEVSLEEPEPSYSGMATDFTVNGHISPRKNIPWMKRKYIPDIYGLHDEVNDLYLWLKPTAEEIFLRRFVFNRISVFLRTIYPHSSIHVFGSVATNLFLPSSDIDIVVKLDNFTVDCLHTVFN